ncbi:MAG: MarR family transcriptional regulator [Planctomycetaceae bacterium]|nr:MarR family transcriptional regulator [Planctomycetaceae bacterium]
MGLGDSLAMHLRAAYFSIRRTALARLAASGATIDQVVVMTLLAAEPALTQREIVERTFSDPSTIRAMLVLLEKRGWVQRNSDPQDARVRRVSLTTEGRKQQRRLKRIGHIGDPANMENLLTDEELRVVTNCLRRIAARQTELADELARSKTQT